MSKCGSMIVYDCGNAARLAKKLLAIRVGEEAGNATSDEIAVMKALIEYSAFEVRVKGGSKTLESHVVVSEFSFSNLIGVLKLSPDPHRSNRLPRITHTG